MITKEHEYMAQALQVTGFVLMTPLIMGFISIQRGRAILSPN